jgi:hypothetical protein
MVHPEVQEEEVEQLLDLHHIHLEVLELPVKEMMEEDN